MKIFCCLHPAGTGKTNTLSKKNFTRWIENKKAEPSETICITFTNKGLQEMKDRIERTLKRWQGDITVKTFPPFCFDIIKKTTEKIRQIFLQIFLVFDEEEDCVKK